MPPESRHVSVFIDRPISSVYSYASDASNLPQWAAGLGGNVELIDGHWTADSPMGKITIAFAEKNVFGVLDHHVTLPSGETFYNPMRLIADGKRTEMVFTIRHRLGVSQDDFETDCDTILADLETLKRILE